MNGDGYPWRLTDEETIGFPNRIISSLQNGTLTTRMARVPPFGKTLWATFLPPA